MRGQNWIKALRQDEARQVRAHRRTRKKPHMASPSRGRQQRQEAGHELRNAKFRLA
ncbi:MULTISPECIES: hypothetical protein [Mesorhizobium]|uniref:hypothetical protein n=1 Tax=Mesorhizobium TaxID=68287 RepID=UPI001FCA5CE0|nr:MULTISPECIES: hypothetical protein [Mesorhizobium]